MPERNHDSRNGPVVAVANQKGGVGKTTIALGIASSAARKGSRVLVIDLDPQANATTSLGVVDPAYTTNDVLHASEPGAADQAIVTTDWRGVDLIASELALQERDSDQRTGVEFCLRESLQGVDGYDLVLIDCPPSVGKLTVNALVAADLLLVVTEPSKVALDGVNQIRSTFQTVRKYLNPRLEWAGIVVNLMPPRGREAQFRLDELLASGEVWQPPIPRREIVREALGAAAPLHDYGKDAEAVTSVLDIHAARLLGATIDITEAREQVAR